VSEVAVPIWVVGSASPRRDHYQRIAVAEVEQRNGVRLPGRTAPRREQQHLVSDQPSPDGTASEPIGDRVEPGEPSGSRITHFEGESRLRSRGGEAGMIYGGATEADVIRLGPSRATAGRSPRLAKRDAWADPTGVR
jgi:hypothetical protein